MAQSCDTDCVRTALGYKSEAEYIADFGALCVGREQNIYCINGVPSIPPRSCTKLFGEARHDYNLGINIPIPAGGTTSSGIDIPDGTFVDLTFSNDTCYAMNIEYSVSSYMRFSYADDANSWGWGFAVIIDGIRYNSGAGGQQAVIGDPDDPFDGDISGYNFLHPASLAPGASMTFEMQLNTANTAALNAANNMQSWASAVRVTGSTVCP